MNNGKPNLFLIVSGISSKDYGKDVLEDSPLYDNLVGEDDMVYEVQYQPIMDKHALVGKTLLDPVRLLLTPDGHRAFKYVESEIQKMVSKFSDTHNIILITHSLGCWMVAKCNIMVATWIDIANPVGFVGVIGRTAVNWNIGKPKIKCIHHYYIYSEQDLVSCKPSNYDVLSVGFFNDLIETGTSHDLGEYLEYLNETELYYEFLL